MYDVYYRDLREQLLSPPPVGAKNGGCRGTTTTANSHDQVSSSPFASTSSLSLFDSVSSLQGLQRIGALFVFSLTPYFSRFHLFFCRIRSRTTQLTPKSCTDIFVTELDWKKTKTCWSQEDATTTTKLFQLPKRKTTLIKTRMVPSMPITSSSSLNRSQLTFTGGSFDIFSTHRGERLQERLPGRGQ